MQLSITTVLALASAALAADFRVTLGIDQTTGQVGNGFDPNRILPTAGDTITFAWSIPSYIENPTTGSHSATQGSFNTPCQPLAGGFDSGAQTTAPEASGTAFTQVFNVQNTDPLYFYSSVDGQCQGGMVLGVNTPAIGSGSIESYAEAASGGAPASNSSSSASSGASVAPSSASASASGTGSVSRSSGASSASNSASRSGSSSASAPSASGSAASGATALSVSGAMGVLAAVVAAAAF